MASLLWHLSGLAAGASSALLASIWQGMVLAGCVGLCLRMVPRLGAAVRSGVWLAVFVAVGALDLAWVGGGSGGSAAVGVRLDARWGLGLAGVWAAVSLVRVVRLVAGAVRLAGVARRATPLGAALEQGLREPLVCSSVEVDRPGVFGFFWPRILLPAGLCERLSGAELEAVLLHEREHLRRGDDWTNLLQKIGLALLPLNPVLAWVERRLCRERELACDDHVLRETRTRKVYAACLARLAEDAILRRPLALAVGLVGRGSELSRRVRRILAQPEAVLGRGSAAAVCGLLSAGMLGGGIELARCPWVVSFGPQAVAAEAYSAPRPSSYGAERKASLNLNAPPRLVRTVAVADSTAARGTAVVRRRAISRTRPFASGLVRGQQDGWVVVAQWMAGGAGEAGFVPVRIIPVQALPVQVIPAHYSISSYATVPVGNGWLVFQL